MLENAAADTVVVGANENAVLCIQAMPIQSPRHAVDPQISELIGSSA